MTMLKKYHQRMEKIQQLMYYSIEEDIKISLTKFN